jgi:hypothetical protein
MDTQLRKEYESYKAFYDALASATPVDTSELATEKRKRIAALEADPEKWIAYYFPEFASYPAATFHKASRKRILNNLEWFEVRSWSRELAKSTNAMFEILYLTLTKKKRNVLLVSNSKDNADRLLAPFMSNLERNGRIINDYEEQYSIGSWTAGEFTTKQGVSFRAIGAGQSPRGTRNGASRPDVICVDDIDTDEDCRNPDIINKRWEWIEQALIPTSSISTPLLVLFCGNIIAEDCCVVRAQKNADKVDIVNIRDENGRSTWPEKNTEEFIDRKLSLISYASQQKEYFNNPISTGRTFPEITWGKCPPLQELQFVVVYADPAPSNKDKPGAKSSAGNSRKATFIVGRKGTRYYVYSGFLDVMGTDTFINSLYQCSDYVAGRTVLFTLIENNTLQDPFYDQVYRPLILAKGLERNSVLGVMPDTRKKPEKWFRIEATLQPINARGDLIFNEEERGNPHMLRLETQFKTAKPNSKELDGPDCIEGAVFIINEKTAETSVNAIRTIQKSRSRSKGY